MDKAKVTDGALHSARSALTGLDDAASAVTSRCASDLEGIMPGLDESFRKDIQEFIAEIEALRSRIGVCVEENTAAVDERLAKMPAYTSSTYKRRNMI